MQPIVDGILKEYRACLNLERVNFHAVSDWMRIVGPIGTPEFALIDSSKQILYRWVGFTEREEFDIVLSPYCS